MQGPPAKKKKKRTYYNQKKIKVYVNKSAFKPIEMNEFFGIDDDVLNDKKTRKKSDDNIEVKPMGKKKS